MKVFDGVDDAKKQQDEPPKFLPLQKLIEKLIT